MAKYVKPKLKDPHTTIQRPDTTPRKPISKQMPKKPNSPVTPVEKAKVQKPIEP